MDINLVSAIVGGALGFIASIGTLTAERIWDRAGRLSIFYLIRSDGRNPVKTFGTSDSSNGPTFVLPLVFELQNTSNTARIMRDVSVNLYKDGHFVDEMTQVGQSGDTSSKEIKEYGGENQSYSFVVQPRSVQKLYGTYMYNAGWDPQKEHDFDEIRLRYFDELNILREYHVRYVEKPWEQQDMGGDEDWILLNKNAWLAKRKVDMEPIDDVAPFDENKISYLQMIQEPIGRMSTASAIFKGFAATIVAGIAALTYCEVNTWILALSFIPVVLFLVLDIYYLKLEKKYRYLYEQVRINAHVVDFSMKLTKDNKSAKARLWDCVKSPSIWLFYPAMIAILGVVVYLRLKGVI
ncbi:MAG: hypothetical protein IIV14_02090 [Bacteroidaceae bacterium]|nr:hypothetical protein [Bacteroidaceae bacterium]